jgi:hypothetical protein
MSDPGARPGAGRAGRTEIGPACPDGLTPECLGLPATPDEDVGPAGGPAPSPGPVPTAPAGFYNHQACPPGRYGCVFSRTVTDERVSTRLSCPSPYASYAGGHALRRLAITGLTAEVRRAVVARRDRLEACLRSAPTSVQVDVQLVVDPSGGVLASAAGDRPCIGDALADLRVPRASTAALVRVHLDYTVEDPTAYATPLDCSF